MPEWMNGNHTTLTDATQKTLLNIEGLGRQLGPELDLKEIMPQHRLSQKNLLLITRAVVLVFSVLVVMYSLWSLEAETSIHEMVENAYKVTLATAFVPLFAGLYWKRANSYGAGWSIVLGFSAWIAMEFIAPEGALPPQFWGFFASLAGMVAGSLLTPARPQHG